MQLCSLESQRENEVAELTSQNEVLKIHIQKMIADHKQQLETQHRELEVSQYVLSVSGYMCIHAENLMFQSLTITGIYYNYFIYTT